MCLAIPAQIIEIFAQQDRATVSLNGVKVDISLALVENVSLHDYVLVHVGFALNKISHEEAEQTLKMFSDASLLQ